MQSERYFGENGLEVQKTLQIKIKSRTTSDQCAYRQFSGFPRRHFDNESGAWIMFTVD